MNRLKIALALSLLVNIGAIGGAAYQMLRGGQERFPGLPAYLGLTEPQRREWRSLEKEFTQRLHTASADIARHREGLIRSVFTERPDPAAIEAERAAIAALQAEQQKHVIAQLLRERAMLDPAQRAKLARLLLQQAPAGPAALERLHRD
ncbi:MAG: periplasmic heavy metal sensor [Sphingomonadaceae bacterium]